MAKQIIVSISREYGSGGHLIGEMIAKDLGLNFYDRNMLDEIAEEKGFDTERLHKYDEKPRNLILTRTVKDHTNSMAQIVAEMQFDYIRSKADSGESFVIVGRCADTVLKGREGLISIFVTGDREDKIAHVGAKYNLTEDKAAAKMLRHDKTRKLYYNRYSSTKWGDSRYHDLCINSSRLGYEGTAKLLEEFVKSYKEALEK